MPTRRWIRTVALAAAGALLPVAVTTAAGTAQGQAGRQPPPPDVQAKRPARPDRDVRAGAAAPTAGQRQSSAGLTVRWNALGTPAVISKGGAPLASGLAGDPERVARGYLGAGRALFGLDQAAVAALEKVTVNKIGDGAAVLLRQRFGNLPAGHDGLVTVGVRGDQVVWVSSSLARDTGAPASATLDQDEAMAAAARDAAITVKDAETRKAALVAVPTAQGVRAAYQVTLIDAGARGGPAAEPAAVTSYVDARDGKVLIRDNLIDEAADPDNPSWRVFPGTPREDHSSRDTREVWCFRAAPGCDFVTGGDPATGLAWDINHVTGQPAFTSIGNAARTVENRANPDPFSVGVRTNAPRPDRNYDYRWTNQWFNERCNPASMDSAQEADLEAAISNLHAMHNRMHDWSYRLGFTETAFNLQLDNGTRGGRPADPELGNAQAGARDATVRNNANQITPPDGIAPITNMYLWQPQAGGFYAPCVDGDYDMSVIGHEYTHAISGRMVGGPDTGWQGPQAGAMNESTSDLLSAEYLNEYGFRSPGETPFVVGGYVTGDRRQGIRNYDMSRSPLNYSDLNYDLVGQQVHADGEIWSATQFDIRQAFIDRYGRGSARLQRECADGRVPLDRCPGNRRWAQLAFDALLLMTNGAVSYVDHRDAMLAADQMRFGGANSELLWDNFAQHGLGQGASSNGPGDTDPVPSFASPESANATVRLRASGESSGASIKLFVGDYESRAVPVADTDPATPLGDTFQILPGRYSFVASGAGFGHKRLSTTIGRSTRTLPVSLDRNHAAAAGGATASGDGVDQGRLIDETEATNWQSLTAPVAGRQVTVDLAGDRSVKVDRVQVSALLRPSQQGDPEFPTLASQNRFTALLRFQVLACDAGRADCSQDASYRTVLTSPGDAFPATPPRPTAPDLIFRSFNVKDTAATHLRLRVLSSQCTGNPGYAGEQDNDPRSTTDCATGSSLAGVVRAAEFQAFSD